VNRSIAPVLRSTSARRRKLTPTLGSRPMGHLRAEVEVIHTGMPALPSFIGKTRSPPPP
jgi:hypothetical protein